ncbi:hypothetical protein DCAR_0313905 [Daucus carota subsp. sativus]|uniref:Cation/H+ exchanger domain-containing protein n=2 Tax=Daucus carota subsp. sativus TaxID=79200 RepID=A0AAF0WRV0_DAUCS|nr:hypothetical protein DCAR_0313905 [Daucus carota subsp. sativus]
MIKLEEGHDPNRVICRAFQYTHSPGIFYGKDPLEFSFPLLLLEVSLVIVITRIVRFVLKPLKQPRIVSEIIGGIIIGPSCLGRNKAFATYVFPDNSAFVMKTIGVLGFVYFLFLCGVKMDLMTMAKPGKKQICVAFFGIFTPIVSSGTVAFFVRKNLPQELGTGSSLWGVTSSVAITAFPVIYTIIKEFNLLSSDIGRVALSTAIISDVIGMHTLLVFEASKQGEGRPMAALYYIISLFVVTAFIFGGLRAVMLWIVRATPEGKPVEQIYIVFILLGVMVIGFISDFLGLAIGNAPLWYGLAIPDGPPLGATLVEKSETIITEILMPFSYVYIGLYTDIFSLSGRWSSLKPLFLITLTGYLAKILATLAVTRFYNMPIRESIALSLILSLRGQVELILFIHWTDLKMITQPAYFTLMVLMTTSATAIASPLINLIYDPTRPYMINKRRNIQHNPPNAELRIVLSIHDEESVPGFISLIEVSNPNPNSPFSVYALRLIELIGRASPLFIDHETQEGDSYISDNYTSSNPIHNALKFSHESEGEYVEIHPFTSVSPKKSMYQDICELALTKKASLIILPFDKGWLDMRNSTIEGAAAQKKVQSINFNVMNHAPCSVALLVDKGSLQGHLHGNSSISMQHIRHYFAVLFLGGPDAREALAFADRMASHPDVSLLVIRFLSPNGEGDDLIEKKLDDGLVTWFWVKNEGNSKVTYKEVVVQNGEDTLSAIQAMNDDSISLWIVGRKHGINPLLLQGLQSWSDHQELGVIGEYVSSLDLSTSASVLVVQQQILRDQRKPSKVSFFQRGFKDCVKSGSRTD